MAGHVTDQALAKRGVLGSEAFARIAAQHLNFDITVSGRRVMSRRSIEHTADTEAASGLQQRVQSLAPIVTHDGHADGSGDDSVHRIPRLRL